MEQRDGPGVSGPSGGRGAENDPPDASGSEGRISASASGPATFSVLQFNMWGWIGYRGGNEIAYATAKIMREELPAVVTLNEACLGQVETVARRLREEGIPYQFHHDFLLHRREGASFCDFGNAVMWLADEPADREPPIPLPIPPGEQERKLLAVRVDCLRLPTVLCVTHLTSGRGLRRSRARRQQILQISAYVRAWKDRQVEVILGGDFNEQPDSAALDSLYLPAYGRRSRGICHEVSGSPEPGIRAKPFQPTHQAGLKYDYIFFTTGYSPGGCRVTRSGSDHYPLFGILA